MLIRAIACKHWHPCSILAGKVIKASMTIRMPIIQRYKKVLLVSFIVSLLSLGVSSVFTTSPTAYAIEKCKDNAQQANAKDQCIGQAVKPEADPLAKCQGNDCGLITKYVNPFITFLAALVGIVVTISIIAGGIQYATSAGDSSKVSQAKERIRNAVIALLAFFFIYFFLEWLIPGGLL
jgi:hypothetical protein